MKCYVNVQYSAPASVNTRTAQGFAASNEISKTSGIVPAVIKQQEFSIYPNPAKTHFTVENSRMAAGAYQLRIVNLLGQEIATSSVQVNSNGGLLYRLPAALASGVYSVQMKSKASGEMYVSKLVIE